MSACWRPATTLSILASVIHAATTCVPALALKRLQAGDGEAAVALVARMEAAAARGAAPELGTCTRLLRALGKARRLDGVYGTLDAMAAGGVRPDAEANQALINALVHSVDFVKGGVSLETLPTSPLPEVAFVGRSNVGKSSLVNMLTNRKGIAKTSKNPGKTRTINHFEMITGDGSPTLLHPTHGEPCHDTRGAWAEANQLHVFGCDLPRRLLRGERVRLLEVGAAPGWNIAATIAYASGLPGELDVTAVERSAEALEAGAGLSADGSWRSDAPRGSAAALERAHVVLALAAEAPRAASNAAQYSALVGAAAAAALARAQSARRAIAELEEVEPEPAAISREFQRAISGFVWY